MAKYLFLSDEWVEEAQRIRAEHQGNGDAVAQAIRMNLQITEVPFGEGIVAAHLDTTAGVIDVDFGHVDEADLTVVAAYEVVKAILVEGNIQAGMQAFMAGRVRVEGDLSKLLTLQTAGPDPAAQSIAERIKEITA